jgi:hypothetical protein
MGTGGECWRVREKLLKQVGRGCAVFFRAQYAKKADALTAFFAYMPNGERHTAHHPTDYEKPTKQYPPKTSASDLAK